MGNTTRNEDINTLDISPNSTDKFEMKSDTRYLLSTIYYLN